MGKAMLMVEQRVADAMRVSNHVEVRFVLSENAKAFTDRPDVGRWLMGAVTENELRHLQTQ